MTEIVHVAPVDLNALQSEVIDASQNPAVVYLSSLQPTGRSAQQSALRQIADIIRSGSDYLDIPWQQLKYAHVQAIRAKLGERYAPATANRMLVALRRVLKESMLLGHLPVYEHERIKAVKPIKGSREPAGRALTPSEVQSAVASAKTSPTATRDTAIIAVLHGTGLRRTELASLDLESFDGSRIKVIGKGNKERTVPMSPGSVRALESWISDRGSWAGPLFVSARKGGRWSEMRLSDESIAQIVKRHANANPHDLRRTYVTTLLSNGVDISTVAGLAGHESVDTTRKYDRRDEAARENAVKGLDTPT